MPLEDMLMSVLSSYNSAFIVSILRWTHGCSPALMEHELWSLMFITHTFIIPQRG